MKKITFYCIATAVVVGIFITTYLTAQSLNFIEYLIMTAFLPLLLVCIVIGIFFRSCQLKKPLISSLILCLIYTVALQGLWIFLRQSNSFSAIYQNSTDLFTSGFSIGSDMDNASLSDMLLPSGLSFLLFYITTAIAARKKTTKLSEE